MVYTGYTAKRTHDIIVLYPGLSHHLTFDRSITEWWEKPGMGSHNAHSKSNWLV